MKFICSDGKYIDFFLKYRCFCVKHTLFYMIFQTFEILSEKFFECFLVLHFVLCCWLSAGGDTALGFRTSARL